MKDDVPSLLSLSDLKKHCLDFRVLDNRIDWFGTSQRLHYINGFLIHKWNRIDMDQALYTEIELQ